MSKQPHQHAERMLQYAQDAMKTDKPYELWEYRNVCGSKWLDLKVHPTWDKHVIYRRKSKTVVINGREVVAPMNTEPNLGDTYYIANPTVSDWVTSNLWIETDSSTVSFQRGLCFETKEDAITYAKALLNYQD